MSDTVTVSGNISMLDYLKAILKEKNRQGLEGAIAVKNVITLENNSEVGVYMEIQFCDPKEMQ